jgi:hypothetical protein
VLAKKCALLGFSVAIFGFAYGILQIHDVNQSSKAEDSFLSLRRNMVREKDFIFLAAQ